MMKRCPECYEVYDPEQNYCEIDGQTLLADPTLSLVAEDDFENVTADPPAPAQAWFPGIVGLMAGILICVGVYVVYSLLMINNESGLPDSSVSERVDRDSFQRDRPPARSDDESAPAVSEEASDDNETKEATGDPVVQEGPAPNDSKVAARLNRGPVSTGERRKDESEDATVRTIIEMKDGTEADVDAAWEDNKGVWYRRGGLVSFVESSRVKAITARAEPKPSP